MVEIYVGEEVKLLAKKYAEILRQQYDLHSLYLYGSYVSGNYTSDSDIDIAVEITGPMGLSFIAMADEIENLFGIKTDVVPKRSIKPEYLQHVEKDIVYA